jgi:3-hydroxybutyryl-CoA dehydrogenase
MTSRLRLLFFSGEEQMEDDETKMTVRRVGVVGLGLLGRGISASLLAGGLDVIVYDRDQTIQEELLSYMQSVMEEIAEHRPASSAYCAGWRQRFRWAIGLEELKQCDLVIESVSEALAVKRELLLQLEEIVGAEIPLASNTSALPITELQRGLAYPGRVVGMHWAEPAFATRFLELIGGEQTSPVVLEGLDAFARSLGKEPCIVGDLPGFIVNRLGYAMYREAMHLLATGVADAATIDRAHRNAGGLWASFCGPFRWIDITGGPALYARAMERVMPELACASRVPAALQEQAERDRQSIAADGNHAATGFYGETQEQKQKWLDLLHRQAWEIEALRTRMDDAMQKAGVLNKAS